MADNHSKADADRQLLLDAQDKGAGATLGAYVRLSGPGWLQSAITLGGGSLAGALFLGVLGGTSLLWLQLVAITMGVVMLSAISYVTLSTGERPFRSINQHINPALGWGWLVATVMANMIWCMPQFSLCFAALQKNLTAAGTIGDSQSTKLTFSAIILVAASFAVILNSRQGVAAKMFDIFLKLLVGMIVICFFGVVVYLSMDGQLNWGEILSGFIPDLSQAAKPTGQLAGLIESMPEEARKVWSDRVVAEQKSVMIGAAATAVGINMTFLMPYTMLNRGWDRPFRGLARFDLCTGMAIPYIIVTSCVVIASAHSFHAKADQDQLLLHADPAEIAKSSVLDGDTGLLEKVMKAKNDEDVSKLPKEEKRQKIAEFISTLPESERLVAASVVKRSAFQLSQALAPLLGEQRASFIFGLGIFGMGFSTIIILMLINGFAVCEMLGKSLGGAPFVFGCVLAGLSGAAWPMVWDGDAKLWLAILTSGFGMILLPIAYITFFMMMNSRALLGDQKPEGMRMVIWNVLMGISVIGAIAAAATSVQVQMKNATVGKTLTIVIVAYIILVVIGFGFRQKRTPATN